MGVQAIIADPRKYGDLGSDLIDRAACFDPNNYQLWHQIAMLSLSRNEMEKAAAAYRRSKQLGCWMIIKELDVFNQQP
jgi:cytochrome c-type biogenesis protein CcmH/NrfG